MVLWMSFFCKCVSAVVNLYVSAYELYTSDPEKEETEAEKMAVLMRGYLKSMKANLREIIHYIDIL